MSYESLRIRGRPQILLYRRRLPGATEVDAFFTRFAGADADLLGMYRWFDGPDDFEAMFHHDLAEVLFQEVPDLGVPYGERERQPLPTMRARLRMGADGDPATEHRLRIEIRDELRTVLSPLPQARYPRFVGRLDTIEDLLERLGDGRGLPVIAIDGIGGVGKTALAREVSARVIDAGLVDAVVWESDKPANFGHFAEAGAGRDADDAAGRLDAPVLCDRIAAGLGLPEVRAVASLSRKKDLLAEVLTDERHLVVVDNLDTVDGYREVVRT